MVNLSPPVPLRSAAVAGLQVALAAIAAICRPDRGAVRLCVSIRQRAMAPDSRGAEPRRAGDHIDCAWFDRRDDDFESADHGDRWRLWNVRVTAWIGRASRSAGMALARECVRAGRVGAPTTSRERCVLAFRCRACRAIDSVTFESAHAYRYIFMTYATG